MYENFGPGVLTFKPFAGARRTNRGPGAKPGSNFGEGRWWRVVVQPLGAMNASQEPFQQADFHEDLPVLIFPDEIGSCWVVGEVEIDG